MSNKYNTAPVGAEITVQGTTYQAAEPLARDAEGRPSCVGCAFLHNGGVNNACHESLESDVGNCLSKDAAGQDGIIWIKKEDSNVGVQEQG